MCGVDLAARQVRWRLRPPPPSRPDARTPGSCRGKRGVFLGFQAISAVTGGAPEKRGTTEARWQPVCRRSSREPGFVVRGRRSRDTSPRKADGGSDRRPPECCRPGESARGMDPSYIPRMSRIKFVIGLAEGLLGPCSSGSNATCRLRRCESLTANSRALSARNIAKKPSQKCTFSQERRMAVPGRQAARTAAARRCREACRSGPSHLDAGP